MTTKPSVTFIICTYNRADYLRDSLLSLLQPVGLDAEFEVLVVDNNSTDATHLVFENVASGNPSYLIRCVKETSQGLSHARNRGIKEAMADNIVFLDDDINASPALVSAWVSFFKNNTDTPAAGGKIHVQFDDPRPEWMSFFLLPLLGHHDLGNSIRAYPQNKYPFGGNMGFKKSLFDEIGLFHTELGRKGASLGAGEEKDLFRRIREKDHSIMYVPDAFLHHRVNANRLTIDYIRNQAIGLGQSMKLQLEHASAIRKIQNWISESFKLVASLPLGLGYVLTGKFSKAKLLFKFRQWIWQGYNHNIF